MDKVLLIAFLYTLGLVSSVLAVPVRLTNVSLFGIGATIGITAHASSDDIVIPTVVSAAVSGIVCLAVLGSLDENLAAEGYVRKDNNTDRITSVGLGVVAGAIAGKAIRYTTHAMNWLLQASARRLLHRGREQVPHDPEINRLQRRASASF